MTSILDILQQADFVVGNAGRPGDSQAVRDALNALNNGSEAVVMFGREASDDRVSLTTEAVESNGALVTVVRDDSFTAAQLSGATVNRASNKLGRTIKRSNPIKNDSNEGSPIVGYILRETH